MHLPKFPHYDELAERRAQEIDEVLEQILETDPMPLRVGRLFETYFLAYAGLASRHRPRTILMGATAYDRAQETGLLAWCREQYPDLTIERSTPRVRGAHPTLVIMDEATDFDWPAT